jgi:hypothetical protein
MIWSFIAAGSLTAFTSRAAGIATPSSASYSAATGTIIIATAPGITIVIVTRIGTGEVIPIAGAIATEMVVRTGAITTATTMNDPTGALTVIVATDPIGEATTATMGGQIGKTIEIGTAGTIPVGATTTGTMKGDLTGVEEMMTAGMMVGESGDQPVALPLLTPQDQRRLNGPIHLFSGHGLSAPTNSPGAAF